MQNEAAYNLAVALKLAGEKHGVAFGDVLKAARKAKKVGDIEQFVVGLNYER